MKLRRQGNRAILRHTLDEVFSVGWAKRSMPINPFPLSAKDDGHAPLCPSYYYINLNGFIGLASSVRLIGRLYAGLRYGPRQEAEAVRRLQRLVQGLKV